MAYQVIARKWRPQRFDDVVGQQAVTRTLRNALASGRLAHAFVFAGPRGVGKTTTARILARALNCVKGPTPEPCGECDACVEIAEGRDIDVLEIDAATHTGVDNVREVIIAGLGILPVRDRYKIFVIDEVHQLSGGSFNALLKSIEEPPPHVVFMMATTELEKIPETVLSRSQVYEFRTISTRSIAGQLRQIADAEGIQVGDDSLQLIARDAEGSMRDAQSKLDQVVAFTGATIRSDDVAAVLGLVGRDLVFDAAQAVAHEDPAAAFGLVARAVETGSDLRLVCRELSRLVRDLLVLSIDPSRAADPEIAAEAERERLGDLVKCFSREDLLRAFDLLTKAEADIRGAAQPRYHLEIALLRWIYLRKLVPIEELLAGTEGQGRPAAAGARPSAGGAANSAPGRSPAASPPMPARSARPATPDASVRRAGNGESFRPPAAPAPPRSDVSAVPSAEQSAEARGPASSEARSAESKGFKDTFLAEVRKGKGIFYNTVVAQAQRIDVTGDRVVFTFAAGQRALRDLFEQNRGWLESVALKVAGRRVAVASEQAEGGAPPAPAAGEAAEADRKAALRERALADAGVQALLEVFPAEIRDVEEM